MRFRTTLIGCALLLGACGAAVDLPPAAPLTLSPAELQAALPEALTGPYRVEVLGPFTLDDADRRRRVRVVAPVADTGQHPLILFSHGFAAESAGYDALLKHWASHGYISLAVDHRDSGGTVRAILASLRFGSGGLIQSRLDDMAALLDGLPSLETQQPGLLARIDVDRIAAAGHSFGAFTAQQLGGAIASDREKGTVWSGRDARIQAVVAISPPGEMFDLIHAQSWETLAVPALSTTGTWDVDGRFFTDWRQHTLAYENSPPGRHWLLVIEGADHYLGNLICRLERDAPPQHEALAVVNAVSLQFLHAWLRERPEAQTFLAERPLAALTANYARLTLRASEGDSAP